MEKNLLALLLATTLALGAATAQAQVYRYNPQTGKSDNISPPPPVTQPATPPAQPNPPVQPAKPVVSGAASKAKAISAADLNKLGQAVAQEKAREKVDEEGTSTDALISAVNSAIEKEEQANSRPMLPFGRVGIIIDPKQYNETMDRNVAQLKAIPDLDKLFMTPPIPVTSFPLLTQWKNLAGTEFIVDTGNMVQQKFGLTKVPGFIYLRPDGTSNTYSLDDLAPFFEALTVQRRKVGK